MQAGGPEVLEFGEIETPKPGPGEVLVNVEAAGVNFIDPPSFGRLSDGVPACLRR
jgi:NADPH:quinone reductase-like Zn-dependent oxidoreductase